MLVDGGDEAFLRRLAMQARRIPSVIEAFGSLRANAEAKPACACGELNKAA